MRRLVIAILVMLVLAPALKAQDTITEVTIKRIYTEKHPQDPAYPQFVVYSKSNNFQLGFGGYAKLTAAFDFNGVVDCYDFITYDIPVGDVDLSDKRLYFDAHQSRLYAEVLGHVNGKSIRIYIETDFYSDHYYPRLRHAYGQIGGFLIGQTWTTLMDLDAMPNTIDFEGPNSAVSLRAPMIRYTFGAEKPFMLQLAAEMPEASISFKNPFAESSQYVPDIILNLKMSKNWGHLQFGGVFRTMTYKDTVADNHSNIYAYGGAFSGSFRIARKNKIMFQAVVGNGIAKYIQDISGVGLDAVTERDEHHQRVVKPLLAGGFYIGYQQYWSKKFNSTFTYGLTGMEDNVALNDSSEYHIGQYICTNLFWEVQPFMTIGIEYLWGKRTNSGGKFGRANRINAMVQFIF